MLNKEDLRFEKDIFGRPTGEIGVSKSAECDTFSLLCFDTVG